MHALQKNTVNTAAYLIFGPSVRLLAALLLTLAFQVDYSRLKPRVETFVSDLLGRELRIAGDMRLELDLAQGIYFYASDASLASTDWTVEPDMARLDTLEQGQSQLLKMRKREQTLVQPWL